MDCPRRGAAAVAGLPDDPLVEILSRVPVKSLCRFKCVSKAWRDLISDPLHRRKLPQTLEGFFCGHMRTHGEIRGGDGVSGGGDAGDAYGGEDGCGGDGVGDSDDAGDACGGDDGCGGCSHGLDYAFVDLMGRSVPLVAPSFSFSFLKEELPGIEHTRILHSCNGLILLGHWRAPGHTMGYVVCNPATEEWMSVPSSGWVYTDPPKWLPVPSSVSSYPKVEEEQTFLIFDPTVSSHFKLLQFLRNASGLKEVGLRTYSSETGVWTDRSGERRRLEEGGERLQLGSFGRILSMLGSAFVNGMLHFIVYHIQKYQEVIVAVDWEGTTRRVISWPPRHGCCWSAPAFFGQSQGRLYCIMEQIEANSAQITIWVLEDYDKEEWVMKHSLWKY
nr:unnamed protein product [Digitaria exilis]